MGANCPQCGGEKKSKRGKGKSKHKKRSKKGGKKSKHHRKH